MNEQAVKKIKAEVKNSSIPLETQEKSFDYIERKHHRIEEDLIRRSDVLAILNQDADNDKELKLFQKILEIPNVKGESV